MSATATATTSTTASTSQDLSTEKDNVDNDNDKQEVVVEGEGASDAQGTVEGQAGEGKTEGDKQEKKPKKTPYVNPERYKTGGPQRVCKVFVRCASRSLSRACDLGKAKRGRVG